MNKYYMFLDEYNSNLYLKIVKELMDLLEEANSFLTHVEKSNQFDHIDDLTSIYHRYFSQGVSSSKFNFKIEKIYKPLYLRVPGPFSKGNSYFHLTMKIQNEGLIWLDKIYQNRLTRILKLLRHLFSKVDNYYVSRKKSQIVKYQKILNKEKEGISKFLEYVDFREIVEKRRKLDEGHLIKIPFGGLFHMVHIKNLPSILEHGVLSHNKAHGMGLTKVDISNKAVNARRNRLEPILHHNIHDYTPLYINPRNPMQYFLFKQGRRPDLVMIEVNPHILLLDEVLYSDGNVASYRTKFYKDIEDFNKLNWSCLQDEYWIDYADGKRFKCSEVLVYEKIPLYYLSNIYTYEYDLLEQVIDMFPNHLGINVGVKKELYFN